MEMNETHEAWPPVEGAPSILPLVVVRLSLSTSYPGWWW